jgi:hypothetical protein
MQYRTSSTHPSDDDQDGHSSLPLEFLPLHDTEQPVSLHRHIHLQSRENSEWILDEQKRPVFWVPPDMMNGSDCYGKKVALGTESGRVVILDFSDAKYCPR